MVRFALAIPLFLIAISLAWAQPKPATEADIDAAALEVLKDFHNRGAELYNAGDPAGCLVQYRAALQAVKPFLKHRPTTQKTIETGIVDADKLDGAKAQSFKLHEVIEALRGELKVAVKPMEPVKPPVEPKPLPASLKGRVTLDGQPQAGVSLTFVAGKKAFTAITSATGEYTISDELPTGAFTIALVGEFVPAKYQLTTTSGLKFEVKAGPNTAEWNLTSK